MTTTGSSREPSLRPPRRGENQQTFLVTQTFRAMVLNVFAILKPIFYKNNAKPPIITQNLHDSAPYFGACLPEIWGRIVQISCDSRCLCFSNRLLTSEIGP